MREQTLSILRRGMVTWLAGTLMACASSGASVQSQQFVAAQTSADALRESSSAVEAPTDVSLANEPNETRDPFEEVNRSVFEFNEQFSHFVAYPVAKAYRETVPEGVHNSIESFVGNLAEPLVFINDVLQLRLGAAATTAGRFAMNSTFGIGGLFDVASKQDLPRQSGDFGQTLYVWGVRDSVYLVLPIVGPANTRDLIGGAVEFVGTIPAGLFLPTRIASIGNTLGATGLMASPFAKLGKIGDMETLEESSIDFYVMMQSVITQKRKAELDEGLATSGWTAFPNDKTMASASPGPVLKPIRDGKRHRVLENTLNSVQ